ncbi:MAG: pyridoxal kinase, partial [Francisella endosymbiont of Hyalomma asiaticum]
MSSKIPKVLSIQSHIAYIYAGNKAAVFPMQKLGIEVSPIYTVHFSNHTQYDFYKGSFFSAEDIQNVINGMIVNGFLAQQNAILSGYIGNLEIAKVIANIVVELKKLNSNSLCCCDPVFGDKYDEDENGHIFASADHPNICFKS